jgi:TPR repeat protein
MELMQKAADAGNALAQFNLAQLYIQQDSGPAGFARALPYYQRAADTGLADAQYAIAQIHATGADGKPADLVKAREYLLAAAKQGFDTAALDLGSWLVDGRGGQRNAREGFAWLKRTAEGGNVAAMNRVAKLYMQGIGTDPNSIDAAAWYILARRAGLNDFEMNDFLAGLTEAETKQALQRSSQLR